MCTFVFESLCAMISTLKVNKIERGYWFIQCLRYCFIYIIKKQHRQADLPRNFGMRSKALYIGRSVGKWIETFCLDSNYSTHVYSLWAKSFLIIQFENVDPFVDHF
ncbi:Schizosaccharomyces specific protein, S. japonicus protein (SJAG_00124) predicted on opposite strand, one is likely incorrect, similarity detected with tblastn (S. japonicus 4008650-4008727) in this frame [Schizosaccharomyces pombe]|uniref:Uncharacterized protein C16G5.19 n=1 Tax=Schizosaccharomyces pombe (strain 972 / ATCC 24843) TaxID=284812 RepID=YH7J_SCHPO|nr:uncharacterized protein SPBC16G5.19 [Schizosaccharomyces pombe]Q96VG0.1 RecName: Full=Uncharacterized protein C16G5.19 [Schizosaccharomyces pombe 972h-]CAC41385.1 sequence orphan [Schizosaccharomyces pombe]|eukprot:NP_596768.1 uncharacterized protein SPBC16G5.19 [Schizosaccharomyces pombe]